jgi:hypothetical protein
MRGTAHEFDMLRSDVTLSDLVLRCESVALAVLRDVDCIVNESGRRAADRPVRTSALQHIGPWNIPSAKVSNPTTVVHESSRQHQNELSMIDRQMGEQSTCEQSREL